MHYGDIASAVNAERLMNTVRAICTGERLSNAAEEAALEVLTRFYEEAGCRVTLERHPGFVSTPEGASFVVEGIKYAAVTHPMTPSVEGLHAPLVYVPIEMVATVEVAQVTGRLVLTDGLAMEPVVRGLEAKGALGVVFITGEYIHNMIVSRVWGSPTPETLNNYVGIPVASISLGDGNTLKDRLAKCEASLDAMLATTVYGRWVEIPCLVAEIPTPHKDFVMVTGHLDSWHLGAMDNASGNACAVELARILAHYASRLKRGVRFVTWSGHSHGRYAGSTAYCDAHFEELHEHCVLNVNADCLGGCCASVMTESPAMASTAELAKCALREAAGVTDWIGCRYSRSCDQSFWGPGVPSIFSQVSEQAPFEGVATEAFKKMFGSGRSGGFGYWWHSIQDTPDKLDPVLLARDVRVFAVTLCHALMDERLPVDAKAEVDELTAFMKERQAKAGDALDLSVVIDRLEWLSRVLVDRLDDEPEVANRLTHEVLREIIPLSYVEGSVYSHDEALRAPPVPMLRDIDHLDAMDEHHRQATLVKLRRQVNRLKMGVRHALQAAGADVPV